MKRNDTQSLGTQFSDNRSLDTQSADIESNSRRSFVKKCVFGAALLPLARLGQSSAFAADAPLVTADDPTAKALKYVEDSSKASGAKPGSKCGNCALYQGAAGSKQGPCAIFPGKQVKAAGWCASWSPKA